MESLGITQDSTINLITTAFKSDHNVFFPFKAQKAEHTEDLKEFIMQIDKIEKEVYNYQKSVISEYKHNTFIFFLS